MLAASLRGWLALVLGGLGLVACVSNPEYPVSSGYSVSFDSSEPQDIHALGPHDVLSVSVVGNPSLSSPEPGFRVDAEGRVQVPLVGSVDVLGVTTEEARRRIRTGLARFLREPYVSVHVLEYAPRTFYVVGHVDEPGAFPMTGPMTAIQAASMGGEPLEGADRENVFLLRNHYDGQFEVLRFSLQTPDEYAFTVLRPNDVILVRPTGYQELHERQFSLLRGLGPLYGNVISTILLLESR